MASAALTGTLTTFSPAREARIRAGGTLIITLTDDEWVAAGEDFEAQKAAILLGIDSDGNEDHGWNAEALSKLDSDDVVRTSATVVTITLPAVPEYDIEAQEIVTVTVPDTAVVGGVEIEATPTLRIVPDVSGFETINVDNTSGGVGLTSDSMTAALSVNHESRTAARRAKVTVESAAVRVSIDPAVTVTASTHGHALAVGDELWLQGEGQMRAFRAIRTTGSNAVLQVSYYF